MLELTTITQWPSHENSQTASPPTASTSNGRSAILAPVLMPMPAPSTWKSKDPPHLPPSLCWRSSLSPSPLPCFLFCRSHQELFRLCLLCSIFQDIQRHLPIGLPFTFPPWDQTWREMPEIGRVLDQRKNQWRVSLPVCGPCGQSQVSPNEETQGPKNLLDSHPSLNSGYSDKWWALRRRAKRNISSLVSRWQGRPRHLGSNCLETDSPFVTLASY